MQEKRKNRIQKTETPRTSWGWWRVGVGERKGGEGGGGGVGGGQA